MEYFELLDKIMFEGEVIKTRFGETKELIDVTLHFKDNNLPYTENARPLEKVMNYLLAEIPWYLSGNTCNKFIVPYAKMWKDIENPDGTANSNYGHLVYYKIRRFQNQYQGKKVFDLMPAFGWALQNLSNDKNTRAGIITYNDGSYNWEGNKDYICSQCQHFLIRDNKLFCIIYLRSSDAIFGLQYNMPWWSLVHQDMLLKLNPFYPDLELGRTAVHIGSSHIYERHYGLVERMLKDKQMYMKMELKRPITLGLNEEYYQMTINDWIRFSN